MNSSPLPYRPGFPELLAGYCAQICDAIRKGSHHDQRRALLLNFLREGFGLESTEVELEHKIKLAEVRGRVDAFWRHLILEVKSDLERERADARAELKKYFEAQPHPLDHLGLVTDGLRFEVYLYESQQAGVRLISRFELEPDQPLHTFRHLDQLLFTGQRLTPTSADLVVRLGQHSAVFHASMRRLGALYDAVASDSTVRTKFREWNALLAKVYGSALGDRMLFLKHTYLVMVSRVVVAAALASEQLARASDFRGLVDGAFFRALGIQNLAEPDFFSWALDTSSEAGFCDFMHQLLGSLRVYDFARLDEDILKELYQELVDPDQRHDLGEYYTPDWLAELTLEQIGYRGGRLLDPSCGSGGFLFAAVQRLRKEGLSGKKLVEEVLENVIGLDVHPVAVLMAKANLLLALGEDRAALPRQINLRVYMADTLMTDADVRKGVLRVPVSEREAFHVPINTPARRDMDELIDRLCALAKRSQVSAGAEKKVAEAVRRLLGGLDSQEAFYWQGNFRLLAKLEFERRNTIWAYILKNAFRPVFLRRDKVDYVVGNPPWLSYRYIKDAGYKKRVKELTFEHGLLERTEQKLFTQMDTSTLFFNHCQREFLKPGGSIAFVLPKTTILPAKQHLKFQAQGFSQLHDLSEVSPLFNVRACVAVRGPKVLKTEIPMVRWSGTLPRRNASLADARKVLTATTGKHDFLGAGAPKSAYHSRFFQGATLLPRCLVFVEPRPDAALVLGAPFLQTSKEAWKDAKPEWQVQVNGQVEAQYLFGSVLAKDLIPFVVRKLSLVALPLVETSHHDLKVVRSVEILGEGHIGAYDWFHEVEQIWERRKKKDNKRSLQAWLDYNNKLTQQNLRAKFIVLYNKSGTNLAAALLTSRETRKIGPFRIRGFIADNVCYRSYAASEEEALYLVGILNTTVVNDAIKPYQPEGLLGERDIHRRPFEVCPIPLFDARNPLHRRIAEVAREARQVLLPVVPKMVTPVATARAEARRLVADQLAQLDALVAQLLDGQPLKYPEKPEEPMKLLELFPA